MIKKLLNLCYLVSVFFLIAGFPPLATAQESGEEASPLRVVGGTEVPTDAFPWQVALVRPGDFTLLDRFCGGVLIAERWVLTAGHCVFNEELNQVEVPEEIQVYAGSTNLLSGGTRSNVSRIIVHPNYQPYQNDIALVELESELSVQPASLPAGHDVGIPAANERVIVTGWGVTATFAEGKTGAAYNQLTGQPVTDMQRLVQEFPARLRGAGLLVVPNSYCAYDVEFRGGNLDQFLCAGWPNGGRDSCHGDSGGPLHARRDDGQFVVVGIVSYGNPNCGEPDTWGKYSRVSYYLNWIEGHVGTSLSRREVGIPRELSFSEATGNRALVVGIDQYALPTFDLVGGSVNDANNFRNFLIDSWGFEENQVLSLVNRDATYENIISGLHSWLVEGTEPGDHVVLYFSGHGYYMHDTSGDEGDGFDEALVPYDVRIIDNRSRPKLVANLITDDTIREVIAALDGRTITIVVDSCFSGTISRGIDADSNLAGVRALGLRLVEVGDEDEAVETLDDGIRDFGASPSNPGIIDSHQHENLAVWTAVSDSQFALVNMDDPNNYEGVFTRAWIDGASGAAGAETVTNRDLLFYTMDVSDDYCDTHRQQCQIGLNPQLEISRANLDEPL